MLRSLMTAVTGVRAHQTMLDVTGNNIANANTTGFKKDSTIFADLMYQANKYASGASDTRGGINPAQVGLGVSVSAIETIHTQGSGSYTGNASDMMIQDKGFFVYKDGNTQLFSRSGALVLDGNSDMVMSGQGYQLQGYKMEETPLDGYQQAAELSTVNIPLGQKIDAKATTQVDYQCNLDSRTSAYLSYGFADLPYNAFAAWNGSETGKASIPIAGSNYDISFLTTGVRSSQVTYNLDSTGATTNATDINYLDIELANGTATTTLKFDITDVSNDTGLPVLSLPKLKADAAGGASYPTAATNSADTNFVGWFDTRVSTVTAAATGIYDGTNAYPTATQEELDKYFVPVYSFPGQTPPQYFAAQYDSETGDLKIRKLTLLNGTTEVSATAGQTLQQDITARAVATPPAGTTAITQIKLEPSSFTYNLNDNMNYTNFQLKGSPTVAYINDTGAVAYGVQEIEYNFVAEFDESTTRQVNDGSSLSKTAADLKLWYYGYSNADLNGFAATTEMKMHRMETTVYFNADGTFDSVDWVSGNDDAPMGYRITDDPVTIGTDTFTGANFQISVGSSSKTSSATDTLNFRSAKNLDTPGPADSEGVWDTVGTTYQGGYHATKLTIYDDNGKEHTLEVTFKKITENRWRWEAFLVERNESTGLDELVNIIPSPRSGEIEFDGSRRISNAFADDNDKSRRGDNNDRYPNAEVEIEIPFSLNGQPNSVVTLNFGGGVGSGGTALDGVTQFASETTTKPVYQDGYTMGVLKSYSVAVNGLITGSYDNGVNIPLYRVALATFANEQGLEKVGNTMFKATVNSGNANIDGATTNGKGSIMSQYVEMSNVDLTEEFTHLIIAQRGFQANARTVTVSDQILEEVVNLKR